MSVINDLLTVAERENGGRTAYDRFDFQTAWGVSKVLELHDAGANYAVGFEFHDDIVELNDADAPTTAIFYQMKTLDSGHWTLSRIVDRPVSGKTKTTIKSSIAGKMFDNVKRFGAAVKKLVIVSNQPLSEIGSKHEEVPFTSLSTEAMSKFVTAMKLECRGFAEKDHLGFFHYDQCRLALGSYEDTVIGQVGVFLHKREITLVSPVPFALHLVNEGRKRSKQLAKVANFEDLKQSKFLTRTQLEGWVEALDSDSCYRPNWDAVSPRLALPHPRDAKVGREWRNYLAERKRRWSVDTFEMGVEVKTIATPIIDGATTLRQGVDAALPEISSVVRLWKPGASDDFITAVAVYEYMR